MKERILAALKAKFPGGNANVLSRIAEKLAKTVTTEEQVTTAVEGVTQGFIEVIESYGDSRATEASKLPEKLRKPYERISVDALSDDEFNKLVGEVTTEVDGLMADIASKGAVFGRPAAHNGGANQKDTLTKEQEAAIGIREGKASADGQPF